MQEAKKLKVLTQNMLTTRPLSLKKRVKHFLKDIEIHDFDLIFLQEAIFLSHFEKLREKYHLSYVKGRFGWPKGGLIVASKEKPKKIQFHKFIHQGVWISWQLFERVIEKGVLELNFENFNVFNTHLVSTHWSKNHNKKWFVHSIQTVDLLNILEERINGRSHILAGDINCNPDIVPNSYQRLQKALDDKTNDIIRKTHTEVDFILSNLEKEGSSKILTCGSFISDHQGIYATLQVLEETF
ncbi:MAG: hypothetical protein Q8Q32_03175 [bacterium]|nr:hypothetical protein [bacterium]